MAVTLGVFLQEQKGTRIIIELKDETAIEGEVVCVDPKSLNIEFVNVIIYRRRIKISKPLESKTLFVKVFLPFNNS